jgi:uncharacterized integral membrane protein
MRRTLKEYPTEFQKRHDMQKPSDRESDGPTVLAAPEPPPAQEHDATEHEVRRVYKGTGLAWAIVAALVGAILLIVLIAQNTGSTVTINFLWFTAEASLVILVLATAVLTVCVAEGIGLIWRHRRRQRLTQRDELRRIHAAESKAAE